VEALSPSSGGGLSLLCVITSSTSAGCGCRADVPVQVHTGYWGDFRQQDAKLMFSFAPRRPDVRFDMLHLSVPMVRDAILMGKTLPNVTLNMAWCAIVSQTMTTDALDEMIDLVPPTRSPPSRRLPRCRAEGCTVTWSWLVKSSRRCCRAHRAGDFRSAVRTASGQAVAARQSVDHLQAWTAQVGWVSCPTSRRS